MYFLLNNLQKLLKFHALKITSPLSRYVQTTECNFNSPHHSFNMFALHTYFITKIFFLLQINCSFYRNSLIPTVTQCNSLWFYRLSCPFKSRDKSQRKNFTANETRWQKNVKGKATGRDRGWRECKP